MPWTKRSGAAAKYRTPEHRAWRKYYKQRMREQGYLFCAQPVCIKPTATISPGEPWHVGHDDTGTVTIGPVHRDCNLKDAAVRARAKQLTPTKRWVL